jgi:hypothetical protein
MTITANDIVLLAAQRPHDEVDGGGFMTGVSVQDGVENNLFPDISTLDRVFGRCQMRKAFAAVVSDTTDTYLGAHVILDDAPDDADVDAVIFTSGGQAGEREAALASLSGGAQPQADAAQKYFINGYEGMTTVGSVPAFSFRTPAGYTLTNLAGNVIEDTTIPMPAYTAREFLWLRDVSTGGAPSYAIAFTFGSAIVEKSFIETTEPDGSLRRTYSLRWLIYQAYFSNAGVLVPDGVDVDADATTATGDGDYIIAVPTSGTPPSTEDSSLAYGIALTTGSAALGATSIAVDRVSAKVVPWDESGDYPGTLPDYCGINPALFSASQGYVLTHRVGDAVVIHNTQSTAPATASNGGSVNCGRTNLSRVRVFGNNGLEITTGFTANLATGIVTWTNVTGYSQPVSVEHRIEDVAAVLGVSGVGPYTLTLNRPLAHAYAAGAKVSSVLIIGDLQALCGESFEQATWTSAWSDDRIGSAPLANYNQAAYPIEVTNAGAITERWALIFTNTTAFRIVGEQVGEILTGTTALPTMPLNPATLEPYFTIPAEGWGVGWSAGNVLRFNTRGANAPVWALRNTSPSEPNTNTDSLTIGIRGDVDA